MPQTPEQFHETYRAALTEIQVGLGDPGFGPVASLDTERSDINRASYVRRAQAKLRGGSHA